MDEKKFRSINSLLHVTWHPPKIERSDFPWVIVDNILYRLQNLDSKVEGNIAYAGIENQQQLEKLCSYIQVGTIYFQAIRIHDFSPLLSQSKLTNLAVDGDPKLLDLSSIGKLTSLKTLILVDTLKPHDLSPLSNLTNLTALQIAGGMWNDIKVDNLDPISQLPNLTELRLIFVKVANGGLHPLAKCRFLKYLEFTNTYPREEFAYLAAHLPNTECNSFAPWYHIEPSVQFDEKDIEVTGKRKPHLNSQTDQKLMEKYSKEFKRLVNYYLSENN
jgi:hypothetical protein